MGEPIFNSCTTLPTLVGMACVWSQVELTPMEHIQLKWNLHMCIPCDNCRLPSPTITPFTAVRPTDMIQKADGIAARCVTAQRVLLNIWLRMKIHDQLERELK